MLKITLFLSISLISNFAFPSIKLVHYNIKELDSNKLRTSSTQLKYVKSVLSKFTFDILSINEMQFDLPNVPSAKFTSTGENINLLKKILNLKGSWNHSFNPANTGMNARKKASGNYYESMEDIVSRDFADPSNFGIFPAQYSTAVLFKYKKISETIISDLTWKEFNPNINFDDYADFKGNKINPNIELFDKNFSDIVLEIEGRKLHLILLHTVPSYNFGNEKSVNLIRNAEQLKFLEWYITGKTSFDVNLKGKITPLNSDAHYIVVGDLNSNINNANIPGSIVLKRLRRSSNLWIEHPSYTVESPGFRPDPFRHTLDYIFHSDSLIVKSAGIYHPFHNRKITSCSPIPVKKRYSTNRVQVTYIDDFIKCYALVNKDYYASKIASDHFPIWATFEYK